MKLPLSSSGTQLAQLSSYIGKYLGFSTNNCQLKKEDFDFILDKVKAKLSGWQANLLSFAGKKPSSSPLLSPLSTIMLNALIFFHPYMSTSIRNIEVSSGGAPNKKRYSTWSIGMMLPNLNKKEVLGLENLNM